MCLDGGCGEGVHGVIPTYIRVLEGERNPLIQKKIVLIGYTKVCEKLIYIPLFVLMLVWDWLFVWTFVLWCVLLFICVFFLRLFGGFNSLNCFLISKSLRTMSLVFVYWGSVFFMNLCWVGDHHGHISSILYWDDLCKLWLNWLHLLHLFLFLQVMIPWPDLKHLKALKIGKTF